MHDQLENFVKDHRDEFDSLNPNPNILNRIQAQMKPSSIVYRPSSFFRWAAAAVVIVLAGIGTYSWQNSKKTVVNGQESIVNSQPSMVKSQESVVSRPSSTVIPSSHPELVEGARNTSSSISGLSSIVYRLKNMESASERYAAASALIDQKKIDHDIIKVLVKTMNNDPNSNVRLAALEALSKYHREPYVKKQLIESMTLQKDPVVQIALIEFLSKLRNTNIKNALQKIAEDNNTDKPVKDQAYSTLTKISL
jgi:hypothetical protein